MKPFQNSPQGPRDGHMLKALAICRISALHQDETSVAHQEAFCRAWINQHTKLPFDLKVLGLRSLPQGGGR
jgi:hypothetical protein